MSRAVPWVTQYASPSLIAGIVRGDRAAGDDPRWPESGAPDRETYAAWCSRWCGMACLRMALLARDGAAPSLYELAMGCEEYAAYGPNGLIYRPFAEYANDKHRLRADVLTDLGPSRLAAEADAGRLVIASVHPGIRRPGQLQQSLRPHAGDGYGDAPHGRLRPVRRPPGSRAARVTVDPGAPSA